MDLRGLEAVVAVLEHGSFSRAAEFLFVSQPALTRRVAMLERELGARLFIRSPRGVSLTDAGQALIDPARRALREAEAIRTAVCLVRGGIRGSLSIVGIPNLSSGVLGKQIARFHETLPDVEIRVVAAESNAAAAAMVEAGIHDVAILELPVTSPDLQVMRIVEEDFVVVFAEGQSGSDQSGPMPTVTKEMIAGRTMVQLPVAQFPKQRARQLFEMLGADHAGHMEVASCGLLLPITRSGRAIAVLPRSVALYGRGEGLDLAAPPRPITRTIGLARRRGDDAPAARQFLKIARSTSELTTR